MAHTQGRPRWRRIRDEIADEIAAGAYGPGARLPTEAALGRRFGVNRHTVRHAMATLAEDGLVRIEQGRGTFVQEPVLDYPVTGRTRFSDILIGAHHDPHSHLLHARQQAANAEMADALLIREGAPVLLLETIRFMDEVPLALTAHYFPEERFRGLVEAFQESGSLTSALYRFGVRDYFRQVTRVNARLPDDDEAHLLRQPPSQPILEHRSINVDPDSRPIEFAIGRYAGQRVRFVFEPRPMSVG